MRLLKPASDIRIGEVVRNTETDFHMVECFDKARNSCALTAHCQLKKVIGKATDAYLAELDKVSLADITLATADPIQTADPTFKSVPVSSIKGLSGKVR